MHTNINRLNTILTFSLFFTTLIYSQSWEYKSGTNAFDGNYKTCYVIGNGENYPFTSPILTISVYNENSLNFYLSKDGLFKDFNIINIYLIINKEPKVIYEAHKGRLSNNYKKLTFNGFVNIGTKEKLSNLQFIEKLKTSRKIDMRVESLDETYDIEFSLLGSAKAINFVIQEYEEAEEKKRREQEARKKKLDELMGGIGKSDGATGSEENDNHAGDKGQPVVDPYANSYYVDGGTGLNNRGTPTRKTFRQKCNESGLVVVQIEVDRNGNVTKAIPGVKGTRNHAECLLNPAKKIALSHKWRPDSKAPTRQVGFVSVNFKLGQ